MQQLIERLLHLAKLEQQQTLNDVRPVPLKALCGELLEAQAARIQQQTIVIELAIDESLEVQAEAFLLRQALANLLDNALDFTPAKGRIRISAGQSATGGVTFSIRNQGPQIPEYALQRLTERFFSLPRPGTGKKSTGLGLNFVQEVMALHRGSVIVTNCDDGVEVGLRFPSR